MGEVDSQRHVCHGLSWSLWNLCYWLDTLYAMSFTPDALLTCHQAPVFAPQETFQEKAGIFLPTPKFLSSLVTL